MLFEHWCQTQFWGILKYNGKHWASLLLENRSMLRNVIEQHFKPAIHLKTKHKCKFRSCRYLINKIWLQRKFKWAGILLAFKSVGPIVTEVLEKKVWESNISDSLRGSLLATRDSSGYWCLYFHAGNEIKSPSLVFLPSLALHSWKENGLIYLPYVLLKVPSSSWPSPTYTHTVFSLPTFLKTLVWFCSFQVSFDHMSTVCQRAWRQGNPPSPWWFFLPADLQLSDRAVYFLQVTFVCH